VVSRTHRQLRRSGQLPPDVDENVQIPEDSDKEVLKMILGVCLSQQQIVSFINLPNVSLTISISLVCLFVGS
jgi:hypothetical protein